MIKIRKTNLRVLLFALIVMVTITVTPLAAAIATTPITSEATTNLGPDGRAIVYENQKTYLMGPAWMGRKETTGKMQVPIFGETTVFVDVLGVDDPYNLALYIDGSFIRYISPPGNGRHVVSITIGENEEVTSYIGYHDLEIRTLKSFDLTTIYRITVTQRESDALYENSNTYYLGSGSRLSQTPVFDFQGAGKVVVTLKLVDVDFDNNLYVLIDGASPRNRLVIDFTPRVNGVFVRDGYWVISKIVDLKAVVSSSVPASSLGGHTIQVGLNSPGDWVNIYSIQVFETSYMDYSTNAFNYATGRELIKSMYTNGIRDDVILSFYGKIPVTSDSRLSIADQSDFFLSFGVSLTDNYHVSGYPYSLFLMLTGMRVKVTTYQPTGTTLVGTQDYVVNTVKTSYEKQDNVNLDAVMDIAALIIDTVAKLNGVPIKPSIVLSVIPYLSNTNKDTEVLFDISNSNALAWKYKAPLDTNIKSKYEKNMGMQMQFHPTIYNNQNSFGIWRMDITVEVDVTHVQKIFDIFGVQYKIKSMTTISFNIPLYFEVY